MNYDVFRLMQNALDDPELLGCMPPILAISLGVVPLRQTNEQVLIAHGPFMYHACIQFLERYFEKDVIPVMLEDEAIRAAISQAYFKGDPVNHDTFSEPEFLLKPENESKLLNEKVEHTGPVHCAISPDEVIFLETAYYSYLINLDNPMEQEELSVESEEIPFKVVGGKPLVHRDMVADDTVLVERRNYAFEGCQSRHGMERHDVLELPHVIHPSEVQLTQIGADGRLTFYIYDRLEVLEVGQSATYRIPYHFISMGQRYSRILILRVYAIHKFEKNDISYVGDSLPWDLEDTDRWLFSDC